MDTPNNLFDPLITSKYYDEYLDTILRYQDLTRTNIFCKYYNIHTNSSIVENETINFDRFSSGIVYDTYDYTPIVEMSGITDMVQERKDTTGDKFEGNTEISIYTINEPRPNDLVIFPYLPEKLDTVFRVKEITTVMSVRSSNMFIFRLSLDYAPITAVQLENRVTVENQYVYLNSISSYIPVNEYVDLTNELHKVKELLDSLIFNDKIELYSDALGNISLDANKAIYELLAYKVHNQRYFSEKKLPFGIKKYSDDDITNNDFDSLTNELIPKVIPLPLTDSLMSYDPSNIELIYHFSDLLKQFKY